ncbi:hypothetical protein GGX14DRAFT_397084 [Mycena pura]|uniref:Uncharacterized protein n=1 Tax=Mycena pura TaxID=153505 RepID=A0AAD6VCX0_9AGAR|nr:hypothetical protein GGX14DRAFT_397084 [Mycena pura]
MPPPAKTKVAQANKFLNNLSNLGTQSEKTPEVALTWLSPRKKHKGGAAQDENNHDDASMEDATRLNEAVIVSDVTGSDDDPFIAFPIAGFIPVAPDAAPKARAFTWKLPKPPKPTVEEVDDNEDRFSTYTFPCPDRDMPSASSAPPFPPGSSLPSKGDDPDLADVPEAEDELLATSASHDDEYPRPRASFSFLERMEAHARLPGVRFQAPNIGEAKIALTDLKGVLRGELNVAATPSRSIFEPSQ